ncbi:MATE family efflux transporter [Kiloniella laminariae]|uniref:MATE family efflux transporter n=1 Tax=Kiloniella laminariae TaxID=454162 RepID=A0ABT4LEB7_9PROT|nr:MATE family efflux transporter [Kiloniella laminariae]MCZ4279440.1 MATE family efflux transporter [Kiloniella laminariae]
MARKPGKSRERDLTQGSLPRHFRALAIPASIGMLFNTLYNVVDTFYAGMLSTEAQAALSVSFTVFFIPVAFGIGLGQGISALVGTAIGKGDRELARTFAAQGLSFAAAFSLFLAVAGYVSIPFLLDLLGVPDSFHPLSTAYLQVIMLATPAFLIAFSANGILSSQGDTVSNQRALIGGFLANCLLNPLFIFGAFGIEGIGFDGLAVSTVVIEWCVAAFLLYQALGSRVLFGCKACDFAPCWKTIRELSGQGLPATLNFLTITLGVLVIQFFLQPFGATAVAAYGIALRIEQLILLPGLGLTIALLPIIAQNNGAAAHDRIRYAFWWCLGTGGAMMLTGGLILLLIGTFLLGFFSADPAVITVGYDYLLLAAPMLPAYLMLFAMMSFLQGVKRPIWTVWIGIYRQVIASAGFAALFIHLLGWGTWGVWAAVFASVWSGLLLSGLIVQHVAKKEIGGLGLPLLFRNLPPAGKQKQ